MVNWIPVSYANILGLISGEKNASLTAVNTVAYSDKKTTKNENLEKDVTQSSESWFYNGWVCDITPCWLPGDFY